VSFYVTRTLNFESFWLKYAVSVGFQACINTSSSHYSFHSKRGSKNCSLSLFIATLREVLSKKTKKENKKEQNLTQAMYHYAG
jgi:hypothetical protein